MDIDAGVAIVTGGGSSIGRALASAFAAGGARVVVGDVDEAGAQAAAEQIRSTGAEALAMRADAAEIGDIEALIILASAAFARSIYMPPMPASWAQRVWVPKSTGTASSTSTCAHTSAPQHCLSHTRSPGAVVISSR